MKTMLSPFFLSLVLLSSTTVNAAPDFISKQQAINIATQKHPGRVLGVKRNEDTFRVKTLNQKGKVHIIKVDAKSGKIKSGK